MPLIEVTEKQYEFLKNLQNEINTQDNRTTAKPYFFQVKRTDRVYGKDLQQGDGIAYIDPNSDEIYDEKPEEPEKETEKEKSDKNQLSLQLNAEEEELKYRDGGPVWKEKFEEEDQDFEDQDQDQDEEEEDKIEYEEIEYQEIVSYDNCFFTEKACLRHIKENKHHYADEEPMQLTYLNAAWRNPEMEMMFEFISSLKFKEGA